MSNPQLLGPPCLACGPTEQCSSCARRIKPAKSTVGRVGRLQFVVVADRPAHTNMHFSVKPRSVDVSAQPLNLPAIEDKAENAANDAASMASAASVFLSDFAALGYENEQLIAITDTSLIYRASTCWFQGAVSIKLLRSELLESRFAQKIFLQEAAMVSDLNHPSVAPLYDYGIASNGAPYMVNHFVPGWSLRELNLRGVIIEPVSLFIQICEGLAFAHSQKRHAWQIDVQVKLLLRRCEKMFSWLS